jgi:hypothetical protein
MREEVIFEGTIDRKGRVWLLQVDSGYAPWQRRETRGDVSPSSKPSSDKGLGVKSSGVSDEDKTLSAFAFIGAWQIAAIVIVGLLIAWVINMYFSGNNMQTIAVNRATRVGSVPLLEVVGALVLIVGALFAASWHPAAFIAPMLLSINNDGSSLQSEAGVLDIAEIRKAIEQIAHKLGINALSDAAIKEALAMKILGMRLVKEENFLVVGPGYTGWLPLLLARLGLNVSVLDINEQVLDDQRRLIADNLAGNENVELFSSCAQIPAQRRFRHIAMFGVFEDVLRSSDHAFMGIDIKLIFIILLPDNRFFRKMKLSLERQVQVAKAKRFLAPILALGDRGGASIFINSTIPFDHQHLVQGLDEMSIAKSALKSLSKGGKIVLKEIPVDVENISNGMQERRWGAAYYRGDFRTPLFSLGQQKSRKAGSVSLWTLIAGFFFGIARAVFGQDEAEAAQRAQTYIKLYQDSSLTNEFNGFTRSY